MLNSRLGLFTATSFRRHPFSRSYGVILPSSLTTLLPLALGSSPHLPVSVCGTGALIYLTPFLATDFTCFPTCNFQSLSPRSTNPGVKLRRCVSVLKSSAATEFPPYVHRLRLSASPSLPAYPGRTNLPPETLDFRPLRFSRNSRYSFRHSHFCTVHTCFRSCFAPYRTLPYPVIDCLSFGYTLSPVKSSAQHHSTSELLRTL